MPYKKTTKKKQQKYACSLFFKLKSILLKKTLRSKNRLNLE